jgi:hypothetical protein
MIKIICEIGTALIEDDQYLMNIVITSSDGITLSFNGINATYFSEEELCALDNKGNLNSNSSSSSKTPRGYLHIPRHGPSDCEWYIKTTNKFITIQHGEMFIKHERSKDPLMFTNAVNELKKMGCTFGKDEEEEEEEEEEEDIE